jgi:hypothetical protein
LKANVKENEEPRMDGEGRRRDNIVVERFCWPLKHEAVYPRDYPTVPEPITDSTGGIVRHQGRHCGGAE